MTEWVNNHKVTCDDCLYVKIHYFYRDGLPFRYDETCMLGNETDYRIPFIKEWDCGDFVKWSILRAIILKIKKWWSR